MATTKGGLAKRQAEIKKDEPIRSMQGLVVKMQDQIKAALTGTALAPERFTRMVLTALSSNPKLQECSPQSFLAHDAGCAAGRRAKHPVGQAT